MDFAKFFIQVKGSPPMQFGNKMEKVGSPSMNDLEARLHQQVQRVAVIASRVFPGARTYTLVEGECFRLCTHEDIRIGLVAPLARVIFVYKPEMLSYAEQLADRYKNDMKKEFKIVKEYEPV